MYQCISIILLRIVHLSILLLIKEALADATGLSSGQLKDKYQKIRKVADRGMELFETTVLT